MSEATSHSLDSKDPAVSDPQWLAGIFEVSGAMFFTISFSKDKGKIYPHAYPLMQLGESILEKQQRLQRIIGGRLKPQREKSFYWYLQGIRAVWLAQAMEPYALSRQDIITAFSNWENAEDVDERIEIAKQSRTKPPSTILQPENYINLVKDPSFLAGVIDSRGYLATQESFTRTMLDEYGWISKRLRVNTTNRPLLEALQKEYGGSITETVSEGSALTKFKGKYTAKNDSLRWTTGHEAYKKVMAVAGKRLKLLDQI